VATFYRRLTHTSLTGLNFSTLAVSPSTTHIAPVECLTAPFLGQSCSLFILHPSPLSLNCTTSARNNMQTIHSFILLSLLRASKPTLSRKLSYSPSGLHSYTCQCCFILSLALSPSRTDSSYSGYSKNPWQYSHWCKIGLRQLHPSWHIFREY
jgi:hypothetical protein